MKTKQKNDDRSGLFIPAGLFIGMGAGFFLNNVVAGLFVGLGLGFFGMAVSQHLIEKKAA
jgi:hypothetical protein